MEGGGEGRGGIADVGFVPDIEFMLNHQKGISI